MAWKYCIACGEKILDDCNFCVACGAPLGKQNENKPLAPASLPEEIPPSPSVGVSEPLHAAGLNATAKLVGQLIGNIRAAEPQGGEVFFDSMPELSESLNETIPGVFTVLFSSLGRLVRGLGQILRKPGRLIPSLVLAIIWIILNQLPQLGIQHESLSLLRTAAFARNGTEAGTLGLIGTTVGKGLMAFTVSGFFAALSARSNPFAATFKSFGALFRHLTARKTGGAWPVLAGCGLALVASNFYSGTMRLENSMVAVIALLASLQALGRNSGVVRAFLRALVHRFRKRNETGDALVGRIQAGIPLGFALALALTRTGLPYIGYGVGGLLLLLALVVSRLGSRRTGAALLILCLGCLIFAPLTGIADSLQDPYTAYGLQPGDSDLNYRMVSRPPAVLVIRPVYLSYSGDLLPISHGDIRLTPGSSQSVSVTGRVVNSSNTKLYTDITSQVTLTYTINEAQRMDFTTTHQTTYSELVYREPMDDYITMGGTETTPWHAVFDSSPVEGEELLYIKIPLKKKSDAYKSNHDAEIYCRIVGVSMTPGATTDQVINTEAEASAGESQTEIAAPIVEGGEDTVATAVSVSTAAAGALAGAAGAAAAPSGSAPAQEEPADRRRRRTYRMGIYKDFGSQIRYNASPVFVYARILELDEEGQEIQRPDLTAMIEITGRSQTLRVGTAVPSGDYVGASVQAEAPDAAAQETEGIITFRFNGPGGTFQNNVSFRLVGESRIVPESDKLFMLAGSGAAFQLPFELIDFMEEPDITITPLLSDCPASLSIQRDHEGRWFIEAVDAGVQEPFVKFFDSYSCELVAQKGQEYARTLIDIVLCHEGILPDYLGKPAELRAYRDEKEAMEVTLVAIKVGTWNPQQQCLDFSKPEELEIDIRDEDRLLEVIGLTCEPDDDSVRTDTALYRLGTGIPLPAKKPVKAAMNLRCVSNGQPIENESDLMIVPRIYSDSALLEEEYQNCVHIISTYMPPEMIPEKLKEARESKHILGVEGLRQLRKDCWDIAEASIIKKRDSYLETARWCDEKISQLNVVVYIGDAALGIALVPLGGPITEFVVFQVKDGLLELFNMWHHDPDITMQDLLDFLERRWVQAVGLADNLLEPPKPNEPKKLAAWLACFLMYRIMYRAWYDQDEYGQPCGIVSAIKWGLADLTGKSAKVLLADFMKGQAAKNGWDKYSITDKDQELMNDGVRTVTKKALDFGDNVAAGLDDIAEQAAAILSEYIEITFN